MLITKRRILTAIAMAALGSLSMAAYGSRNLYVATNGNDNNDGLTPATAVATLSRAHDLVDIGSYGDHTIYVRGGTYRGVSVVWRKHSPASRVTITTYQDEKPVFDGILNGQMAPRFLRLVNGRSACSNVTISGLTIRHYLHHGIQLLGGSSGWLGCNTIEDNVFEENGDLYLPAGMQCSDTLMGFGTVDLVNSRGNVIRNNVMVKNEDCERNAAHMHAVYLAHGSSDNEVYGNYISMTSGNPLHVRDGSNDNYFHDNYVDRSGAHGFVSGWRNTAEGEELSHGNIIEDNIFTFPYPTVDSVELICHRPDGGVCDTSTFIDRGQVFVFNQGAYEEVGAMTSADFDGDQQTEAVVAFNYFSKDWSRAFRFSKVVRSTGGADRHLSKVLYIATHHSVQGMTAGDFTGNGRDEALTYFERVSDGLTRVYRGNGVSRLTTAKSTPVPTMTSSI